MPISRTLDVTTSWFSSALTLGAGMTVTRSARQPERPIELYEFESCPFCRRLREGLSSLDVDAIILPCPPRGTRFRPEVEKKGGKQQFPYMVDPNSGTAMYESKDILSYVATTYGDGTMPTWSKTGPLGILTGSLAAATRYGRDHPIASTLPEQMLELWSFEASPYCRIVRETLCAMEIPYRLHNVAKGSAKRAEFRAMSGKMRVPFLRDPNTNTQMFESADIVNYMLRTYGA